MAQDRRFSIPESKAVRPGIKICGFRQFVIECSDHSGFSEGTRYRRFFRAHDHRPILELAGRQTAHESRLHPINSSV